MPFLFNEDIALHLGPTRVKIKSQNLKKKKKVYSIFSPLACNFKYTQPKHNTSFSVFVLVPSSDLVNFHSARPLGQAESWY